MAIDSRFDGLTCDEIAQLLLVAGQSEDSKDKDFAKACAEELRRRPNKAILCTVCGATPPFTGGTRCQRTDCGLINWSTR